MKVSGRHLQDELVGTRLSDLSDVGELDDSVGLLVGLILGVEVKTLSGLEGVGSGSLGSRVLVEVALEGLLGDGLVLEVEEALALEETAAFVSYCALFIERKSTYESNPPCALERVP